MILEYKIKPIARYIITEYRKGIDINPMCCNLGEYESYHQAGVVHRALVASADNVPSYMISTERDGMQGWYPYYAHSQADANRMKKELEELFAGTWSVKELTESQKEYFSGPTH